MPRFFIQSTMTGEIVSEQEQDDAQAAMAHYFTGGVDLEFLPADAVTAKGPDVYVILSVPTDLDPPSADNQADPDWQARLEHQAKPVLIAIAHRS